MEFEKTDWLELKNIEHCCNCWVAAVLIFRGCNWSLALVGLQDCFLPNREIIWMIQLWLAISDGIWNMTWVYRGYKGGYASYVSKKSPTGPTEWYWMDP